MGNLPCNVGVHNGGMRLVHVNAHMISLLPGLIVTNHRDYPRKRFHNYHIQRIIFHLSAIRPLLPQDHYPKEIEPSQSTGLLHR